MGFWCHTLLQNIATDLRYKPEGEIVDRCLMTKLLLIVRSHAKIKLGNCLIPYEGNITYCYSTNVP